MVKGLLILASLCTIGVLIVVDAASALRQLSSPATVMPDTTSEPSASMSAFTFAPSPNTQGNTGNATAASNGATMNWAGYMSTGGTYTSISGSWAVPSITAVTDPIAADATWIGIGGNTSTDLIQVGTENTVENGQVVGDSFYEQLPNAAEPITTVSVNAGDTVTASIKEVSAGEWAITIEDMTNGESYSNTVAYNSSESSAEWIEEAPSSGNSVMPLDQFGSVTFTNGTTTDNGNLVTIAGSKARVINMDNQAGEALVTVSSLTSSGNAFVATRTSASSDDATGQYVTGSTDWSRQEPGLDAYHRGWRDSEYPQQPDGYAPNGFYIYGPSIQ